MLTQPQEDYLATFADAGIAEQQAIADRNTQVALDAAVQAARDAKLAALNTQAQTLIETGLAEFETNVVPTITATVQSDVQTSTPLEVQN